MMGNSRFENELSIRRFLWIFAAMCRNIPKMQKMAPHSLPIGSPTEAFSPFLCRAKYGVYSLVGLLGLHTEVAKPDLLK